MKTKIALLVLALIGMMLPSALPSAPLFIATTPAHAATNNLVIGYYNSTAKTTVAAKQNVSVYLGDPYIVSQDGYNSTTTPPIPSGAKFVINFSQITLAAGEVTLYLSTNGYAQISSSDIQLYSLPTYLINSTSLEPHTVPVINTNQTITLYVGNK
ncbi:MAG: hypothetical protein ACP5GH_02650, partial [Nitrososphaeria archaeon]